MCIINLWPRSPYLVDRVCVNCVVEASVEIVEKIDHLKGCRARGYCRETDNVGEINRDLAKLLGVDGHAELQFLGDRAESIEPSLPIYFRINVRTFLRVYIDNFLFHFNF